MTSYVLGFQDIDKTELMLVGGKGANLGELSRIAGIHVPEGFCISTAAFERIIGETPTLTGLLDQLAMVRIEDRARIVALSGEIRRAIEGAAIPAGLSEEITRALLRLGEADAYAVRSSATAEDLPTASFAGQQDTYLNIIGREAILAHISKCWASLFTERAVMYRLQNDFDHRKVHLAVVVQKMVFSEAAGILFTADPVSSDRKVLTIDASFGLGEAMVSGLVNTDSYRIRHGKIIDKTISTKNLAIYASAAGGTKEQEIDPEKRARPALTDEQALQLERIGRMVENHFGQPQDIEWCLVDGTFHLVQSRPITTLFPIPEAADEKNRVYISVGHQQMMTDAMKPLGLSFFLLITPAPMRAAGGRLFVDVTDMLTSAESRDRIVEALGKSDPLIKDAITTVIERDDFLQIEHNGKKIENRALLGLTVVSPGELYAQFQNDPTVVADLVQRSQASIEELKRTIQTKSGDALLDFILEDIQELKKILFDPRLPVILGGMNAASWLNDNINAWLGERSVADTLTQSVADNITSEMGLELLDVADVIRPFPKVMTFLQQVEDEIAWDELIRVDGGREAKHAIEAYIDKYGMRCAGEIDITRTRWSEKPATIVPMILSNVKNFEPGAGREKFEQGRQEALEKERELLARLKRLPEGEQKADDTEKMIDLVRRLSGYREYPKYGMVSRLFIYKQALMNEAERLVQAGVLREREDIYYLTLEELRDTVRSMKLDYQLVEKRREEYRFFERLTPSRVMTSDGEGISGEYRRADLPAGAIAGLAVSSGVVEGRARVLRKMEDAELAEGDILVTTFTDPSWTPAFVSIKGLVTEVGGLMTHGAVIAREYGLPAVVGVGNATTLIKEGQRIRVHGTEGYVELL